MELGIYNFTNRVKSRRPSGDGFGAEPSAPKEAAKPQVQQQQDEAEDQIVGEEGTGEPWEDEEIAAEEEEEEEADGNDVEVMPESECEEAKPLEQPPAAAKRGPGRPRKTAPEAVEGRGEEQPPAAKRGPGRPRKTAPPAAAEDEDEGEDPYHFSDSPDSPNGRKQQQQPEEDKGAEGLKRGRPRGQPGGEAKRIKKTGVCPSPNGRLPGASCADKLRAASQIPGATRSGGASRARMGRKRRRRRPLRS